MLFLQCSGFVNVFPVRGKSTFLHPQNLGAWAQEELPKLSKLTVCIPLGSGQVQFPATLGLLPHSEPPLNFGDTETFFYKCGNRTGTALQNVHPLYNWRFSHLSHQTVFSLLFFSPSLPPPPAFFFSFFLLLIACYSTIQEAIMCSRSYNKMDIHLVIFHLFTYFS